MELWLKVQEWLPHIAELFMALSVVATIVIRLPGVKGKKDTDSVVDKVIAVIDYLPTIGVNPRTKELKEAIKAVKK